jgi:carbamoyltransferase
MNILGINAYHGDVSAALIRDGELIAAVEEERFRRVKHWAGFPGDSIRVCMDIAGLNAKDIDFFAISRNPSAHLIRKALFGVRHRPNQTLIRDRLQNRAKVGSIAALLAKSLGLDPRRVKRSTYWVEHHPAHLASTFFVSPFDDAAVCAIDGFGDFVSTSTAIGRGSKIRLRDQIFFPHSLGILYLALTQYLGFHKYGDEFKVMGLAPYGGPDFVEEIRQLIELKPKGRFALDLDYFRHWSEGVSMTWDDGEPTMGPVFTEKLDELLGPRRSPDEPIESRHEAIAASLQVVFEEAVFHVLRALHKKTRLPRLCLAGGCAMNSVANGKIRSNTPFEDIYIQPAAGDNGTALGAAYYVWNQRLGRERRFTMKHAYWGPEFDDRHLSSVLKEWSGRLESEGCTQRIIDNEKELAQWAAIKIIEGKVVGWFQGRMEWGARALGNRSILADPRRSDMREIINTKIKFREKFRPFAPSVLEEHVKEYFIGAHPDPYMIQVYPVHPDKKEVIPAVTHVDGSCRLQTVSRNSNPLYWELIHTFGEQTGVPILLNTSFNENEPIVHRPGEALDCFLRTKMDALVLGRHALEKQ